MIHLALLGQGLALGLVMMCGIRVSADLIGYLLFSEVRYHPAVPWLLLASLILWVPSRLYHNRWLRLYAPKG